MQKLKKEDGPRIQVHGSGNLIQTLLRHDLVDELWLKIFPVTLGTGKRLLSTIAILAMVDRLYHDKPIGKFSTPVS